MSGSADKTKADFNHCCKSELQQIELAILHLNIRSLNCHYRQPCQFLHYLKCLYCTYVYILMSPYCLRYGLIARASIIMLLLCFFCCISFFIRIFHVKSLSAYGDEICTYRLFITRRRSDVHFTQIAQGVFERRDYTYHNSTFHPFLHSSHTKAAQNRSASSIPMTN